MSPSASARRVRTSPDWRPTASGTSRCHSSTRGMHVSADLRAAWELWRLLRREHVDVLHTHNPKPGLYGRVVGRLARVPIVVNTVHGLYAADDDGWSKRLRRVRARSGRGPVLRRRAVPEPRGPRAHPAVAHHAAADAPGCSATASTSPGSIRDRLAPIGARPRSGRSWGSHPTTSSSARWAGSSPRRATPSCSRRRGRSGPVSSSRWSAPTIPRSRTASPPSWWRRRPTTGSGSSACVTTSTASTRRSTCSCSHRIVRVPPRRDGGRGHGPARHRHRHPRLPAGGRRRHHRDAGAGQGSGRVGSCAARGRRRCRPARRMGVPGGPRPGPSSTSATSCGRCSTPIATSPGGRASRSSPGEAGFAQVVRPA